MTLIPVFNVSLIWSEYDPDGKECTKCNLPIYGKMYGPAVQYSETDIKETVFTPIETRLCEPCYTIIK